MAKNWAIAIGINKYRNLQPLQFAKQDAELMCDFFVKAGFDENGIFLFTDDSPEIETQSVPIPTNPTYGTIRRFLRAQFEKPLLQAGDNLWFFFAGHGVQYEGRDYLMLSDSDPGDIEHTAIAVSYITERLQLWDADNVVLFLDACRNSGSRSGLGIGEDVQQGVVTFYSCSPKERSWEIEQLEHGAFTYVLHDALQIQGIGNCATVERLSNYLRHQVPLVNQKYGKSRQTPYAEIKPDTKYHLILLAEFATLNDISAMKNDAYRAEAEGGIEQARTLWIRVNVAARGTDMDAINALQRIVEKSFKEKEKKESSEVNLPLLKTGKNAFQHSDKIWFAIVMFTFLFLLIVFTLQLHPNESLLSISNILIIGIFAAITLPSFLNQSNKARQSEAKTYIGLLNRSQQAFYLEHERFASNLDELDIGLKNETENYSYRIIQLNEYSVQSISLAKKQGLKNYLGVVWITEPNEGYSSTLSKICESNHPSTQLPVISEISRYANFEKVSCPDGYSPIQM